MTYYNKTAKEFTLVGLSNTSELQLLFFFVFLSVYIVTLSGNVFIILAYTFSPALHTPMYFFLANFSILEIGYVTSTTPKMLSLFFIDWNPECNKISLPECVIQLFCSLLLGGTEFYILAAMAYDRYNAICHPLLYISIMNRRTCIQLITISYLIGIGNSLINSALTFSLPYCRSKVINSFFCDVPALLKLSCTDTKANEAVIFVIGGGMTIGSLLLISTSYIRILSAILNIHSASGRKKAFSTCTSHLIVVTLFYGSVFFMYLKPKSRYADEDKVVSIVYTIVAPFLNPFIYSLRNNEVKIAVRKIVYNKIVVRKY
ncbi:olfactory receptor 8U1-like [Pyxicephalus adspersus]|uniref:olfactory receptor 8U1-like n=1 Tax=Pyxicephalus adspersus TaxID=30357 RepID=UPI003B5BF3D5